MEIILYEIFIRIQLRKKTNQDNIWLLVNEDRYKISRFGFVQRRLGRVFKPYKWEALALGLVGQDVIELIESEEKTAQHTIDMFSVLSLYNNHWSELSACAALGSGGHYFAYIIPLFSFLFSFLFSLTTAIQNHRRGCHRVSNFCMGP
jgi:hypothetical protein